MFRKFFSPPSGNRSNTKENVGRRCPRCLRQLDPRNLKWRCHEGCQKLDRQTDYETSLSGHSRYVSSPSEQSYPCPQNDCSTKLLTPYPENCPHPYDTPLNLPSERVRFVTLFSIDGKPAMPKRAFGILLYALTEACSPSRANIALSAKNLDIKHLRYSRKPRSAPFLSPGDPACIIIGNNPMEKWPGHLYVHTLNLCDPETLETGAVCGTERPSPFKHPSRKLPENCRSLETQHKLDLIRNSDDAVMCVQAQDVFKAEWREKAKEQLDHLNRIHRASQSSLHSTRARLWIMLMHCEDLFTALGDDTPGFSWFETVDTHKRDEVINKYVLEVCGIQDLLRNHFEDFQEVRCLMAPGQASHVSELSGIKSFTDILIEMGSTS